MTSDILKRAEEAKEWLIHKAGRGWYRPNAMGYTGNISEAGRYSHADALSYSHPNGWSGPRDGITIKHISEYVVQAPNGLPAPDVSGFVAAIAERDAENARLTARAEAAEALLAAATGMVSIVEGIDGVMNHGTWRDERGMRLKDTPEWVSLYIAHAAMKEGR